MKIAIDTSPLTSGHYLQHRVRGTGFYITNLLLSLRKNFPKDEFMEFSQGGKVPGDVSVTHYPYFETFFLTLPKNISKNCVVTVHDLTPIVFKDKFPAGIKGTLRWQLQKRRLKKAGAIITDSMNSKKDIQKILGIDDLKIHVVYLSAASIYKPQPEAVEVNVIKKYGLPSEFAIYVGDVTWNKNLVNLISAFEKVNLPLIIVGKAFLQKDFDKKNPWNRDLVKAQSIASKNKNVHSLGFVPDEDLAGLYSASKVFVMPSFYEGFGLPVLEAMASGCPVITSKAGSIPEIAGDAAYYVDPQSPSSIAEGINTLLKNKSLMDELSNKGLVQAKKFSWDKTAQETMKVYRSIANNGL